MIVIRSKLKFKNSETFPRYSFRIQTKKLDIHPKESIPKWLCNQNHKTNEGCHGYWYGGGGDPMETCINCKDFAYKEATND